MDAVSVHLSFLQAIRDLPGRRHTFDYSVLAAINTSDKALTYGALYSQFGFGKAYHAQRYYNALARLKEFEYIVETKDKRGVKRWAITTSGKAILNTINTSTLTILQEQKHNVNLQTLS